MKETYPRVLSDNPSDLAFVLRKIVQLRKDDISDFQDLLNVVSPFDGQLPNYANDTAAAAGGVPIYGFYRNGNAVQQRLT